MLQEVLSALLVHLSYYREGIIVALVVCIVGLILQIPFTDEDAFTDPDWWQTLSQSAHANLCIPPTCFSKVSGQLSSMSTKPFLTKDTDSSTNKLYRSFAAVLTTHHGFIFHPENLPEHSTPLLCFINSRAGGYQGAYISSQLRKLLNPNQVCDLAVSDPALVLKDFSVFPGLRILACGGDGTVGWILNCIEKLPAEKRPPVAILPLGTGNDLARVLGWGTNANDGTLPQLLQKVQNASITMLDRWKLSITVGEKTTKSVTFNNYFGVGVDAQIVLKFHLLREKTPERFFSQFTNKIWYAIMGLQELWRSNCVGLGRAVQLFADGVEVEVPEDTQGFVFLNISSYAGGVKLWSNENSGNNSSSNSLDQEDNEADILDIDRSSSMHSSAGLFTKRQSWHSMSMQDGLMEVVALKSPLQFGRVKFGLEKCQKLAQASKFVLKSKRALPLQADGEPWGEAPCTITIEPAGQAFMLKQTTESAESDVTSVLEWAERNSVINSQQKIVLLHEFSIRSEHRADKSVSSKCFYNPVSRNSSLDLLQTLQNGSPPQAAVTRTVS